MSNDDASRQALYRNLAKMITEQAITDWQRYQHAGPKRQPSDIMLILDAAASQTAMDKDIPISVARRLNEFNTLGDKRLGGGRKNRWAEGPENELKKQIAEKNRRRNALMELGWTEEELQRAEKLMEEAEEGCGGVKVREGSQAGPSGSALGQQRALAPALAGRQGMSVKMEPSDDIQVERDQRTPLLALHGPSNQLCRPRTPRVAPNPHPVRIEPARSTNVAAPSLPQASAQINNDAVLPDPIRPASSRLAWPHLNIGSVAISGSIATLPFVFPNSSNPAPPQPQPQRSSFGGFASVSRAANASVLSSFPVINAPKPPRPLTMLMQPHGLGFASGGTMSAARNDTAAHEAQASQSRQGGVKRGREELEEGEIDDGRNVRVKVEVTEGDDEVLEVDKVEQVLEKSSKE
ncbi:uncharacterized protein MKK02DRAFT_39350 [Dioszegia hungarica]|uniref:Uncharacterized protein n=1 Tax=Dioszegia hungarica TaxID=4972 RepID=A0AA38LYJ7_9TREE|nr:uncharacterized protein MKK02DRAFT_39350 [Dioszegia hungarica]KAI9639074.1 hypothetical protein MKK02DRAFT_39350 [Dioszegia hungarica]